MALIHFPGGMTPAIREKLEEALVKMGGASQVAADETTVLVDGLTDLRGDFMGDLARASGQVVEVNLHDEGEVVTMQDGTQYRVHRGGWRKIK